MSAKKIAIIRSYGFWVRVCDDGSPVRYIIVDPGGDEDGWMCAGDEDVLDLTIETHDMKGNGDVDASSQNVEGPRS